MTHSDARKRLPTKLLLNAETVRVLTTQEAPPAQVELGATRRRAWCAECLTTL